MSPADYEVDFYLPQSGELIQVSQSLAQLATREQEIRAFTDANAAPIAGDGCTVEMRSLAEWLLPS